MKQTLQTKSLLSVLMFLVFSLSAMAQLTVTVVPTNAPCPGLGMLTFNATGGDPGAQISYTVYSGPTTASPQVAIVTTNTLTSLPAGTYTVVASQSVQGVVTSSPPVTVQIIDDAADPQYDRTIQGTRCGNDGKVTVITTRGIAQTYKLYSGLTPSPATLLQTQTTATFTNLAIGEYTVVVTDVCGRDALITVRIVLETTNVRIDPVVWPVTRPVVLFDDWSLVDCNHISTQHRISTVGAQVIFYPVTITYVVSDPNGVPQAPVTQVIADGVANNQSFRTVPMLFYPCQQYSYTMTLVDACGNTFNSPPNIMNECFEVIPDVNYGHCDETITFTPHNYAPPYTVTFTSSTVPGWDQHVHNPDEDPNFSGPAAVYSQHVPDGTYAAEISNCGRVITIPNIIVQKPDQGLVLNGTIPCGETMGIISGAFTKAQTDFVHVTIVPPYPPGFTGDTNLDSGINPMLPSEFNSPPLPNLGTYYIQAESECPDDPIFVIPVTFEQSSAAANILYVSRPGCEIGEGSLYIYAEPEATGIINGVQIVSGPEEWERANPGVRPVDVSFNLAANNRFYMNSLPGGDYIINIIDGCGTRALPFTVLGYTNTVRTATVDLTDCLSFGIDIDVQGNNNLPAILPTYWLQKKNADGEWSHPSTGVAYPAGEVPKGLYYDDPTPPRANDDSVRLYAPSTNAQGVYTHGYGSGAGSGEFRVIEVFPVFGNGVTTGSRCVTELAVFTTGVPPVIDGVFSFPCSANSGEAIVSATTVGNPDDLEYSVDGGVTFQDSNVFTGLSAGVQYTFTVKDRCNTANLVAEILPAASLAITQDGACENQRVAIEVPEYNFLTYEWYNTANPTVILSTTGTLEFPRFVSANNAGTYEVRVTNPTSPQSCLNQTLSYTLAPNALPNAGVDNTTIAPICTGSVATLDLSTYLIAPFDATGAFSQVTGTGGTLTGSVFDISTITTGGVYEFNYTVTDPCGNNDVALLRITLLESPAAPTVAPIAVQCEGSTITLTAVSTTPGVTYEWTTPRGTFTGATLSYTNAVIADSGSYSVVAKNGICESAPTAVTVTVTAAPNAGGDNSTPICNTVTGTVLDLADYLVAPFDAGGTWDLSTTNTPPAGSFNAASGTFDTANLFGTYDFTYSVTACGTTDVAVISFVLNAIPNAPVATVAAAVVCENGSIQLNTPAVTGAVYSWTKGGTVVSTAQNPAIPATLAAAGDYVLTISVNGCTADSAPVNVVVTPLPQFSLAGNTVICPTQFTTLSVVPSNFALTDAAISYQWTLNGGSISNAPTARVDALGDYIVTVTNANGGCPTTHTITVTADPDPFSIVLAGDCVNERFIMSITNIAEIGTTQSIVWSGPGISETAGNNPTIDLTAKLTGTYSVTVTNADGCFKTQTIDVTSTSCMIPRGISPEEVDGKNDFFDLTNLGVQNLQIFNRYGLQVYEKNNYTKEWYGQSDKGDLPTGTYFYVAKMADKQVTGWVYIQRNSN